MGCFFFSSLACLPCLQHSIFYCTMNPKMPWNCSGSTQKVKLLIYRTWEFKFRFFFLDSNSNWELGNSDFWLFHECIITACCFSLLHFFSIFAIMHCSIVWRSNYPWIYSLSGLFFLLCCVSVWIRWVYCLNWVNLKLFTNSRHTICFHWTVAAWLTQELTLQLCDSDWLWT